MMKDTLKIMCISLFLALIIGGIFGITSFLDGYGDARLFIIYILLFLIVFINLNLVLAFYAKLRKINLTFINQFFLVSMMLLSLFIFFITNYLIKIIFRDIEKSVFREFSISFSFFLAIFSFFFLSFFIKKRVFKYIVVVCSLGFICAWFFITAGGSLGLKRESRFDKTNPNILLLTIESLRYDYLGCNGNNTVSTPFIDKLAERGIVFCNYFVQAPYTTSSLATLLTGSYPYNHGARAFGECPDIRYRPFYEYLIKNDYFVRIDANYVPELFPDNKELFDLHPNIFEKIKKKFENIIDIGNEKFGSLLPELFGSYCFGTKTSMRQTSSLLRNIRLNRDNKWFFWTHFYKNCHIPYESPPQFTSIYKKNRYFPQNEISYEEILELNRSHGEILEEKKDAIRSIYSAEVSCIDRQIGYIIDQLTRLNLLEKTVVILTSDHGELLGEFGYIGHGVCLKDKLMHVPLIIWGADAHNFRGGRKIYPFIEEVDIAPTVFDFCGIDKFEQVDGKSIFEMLRPNGLKKKSVYGEAVLAKGFFASLRMPEFKLVWNSDSEKFQLFNLINDPDEHYDTGDILIDRVKKMQQEFLVCTGMQSFADLKPFNKPIIGEKMMREMKALGYIK